ncbi:hypothetical protein MMC07_005395 [Pseudocyphellaria aurata]|nr:hypothetical protein [Pseudocyphellaria aurata]
MTKQERKDQMHRAARQARDAGMPHGRPGYGRHAPNDAPERKKQLLHTRRALTRSEGANAQGAQADVAQENTHGGVFGVFHARSEPSAMGERRSDFGSAFRPGFDAPPEPQKFPVNLADIFPPRPNLSGSPASPLPAHPENQMMPSLDTFDPPRHHSTQRYAVPPDFTALPHAEDNSSGDGEPQDAQELLGMADWADGLLGDLDRLE